MTAFADLTLGKRLGGGSLAEVFLATTKDGETVVVKRLRGDVEGDPARALMLLDEGELLSRLSHPHLVRCLETSTSPVALILRYVEAEPLASSLGASRGRGMEVTRAVEITLAVAKALAYLHDNHVWHLDLGPDNVLVDAQGGVTLTDLARGAWPGKRTRIDYEPIPHKLGYCAPELWLGKPLSAATDVYTLGVMLWEMLAGRTPEHRRPPRHGQPLPPLVPLQMVRPGLPEKLVLAVAKMCAAEPNTRPRVSALMSAAAMGLG